MRVLWFTNIPMPAMDARLGVTTKGSGYWMISLLEALAKVPGVSVGVVTAWPGAKDDFFALDGVDYFLVGQPKGTSHLSLRADDLERCRRIVEEWRPDVVHVHGTERFYGLLAMQRRVSAPIVISIQGLLSQYLPHFLGRMSVAAIVRSHQLKGAIRGYGLLFDYLRFRNGALREKEILRCCGFVLGRTAWDRAHAWSLNPSARYFQVGEMLRPAFSERTWDLEQARRHSLIFTNARSPIRNIEVMLEAVALLRREFPDVTLSLAGSVDFSSGYGKHLQRTIQGLGLEDSVKLLGYLNDEEMVGHMLRSHVFCNSAFMENSPNSLCEAQLLGMPCVASYVGGIPSLINDGETGLLFPTNDSALLAQGITAIFADDELARTLGNNAQAVAMARHDRPMVVSQLLNAYQSAIVETAAHGGS